jgi:hypothetical protein
MYRDKQNGKYIVSLKRSYMRNQLHRFNVRWYKEKHIKNTAFLEQFLS